MDNFPAFADYLLVLIFGILLPFISGVKSAAAFKDMQLAFDSPTKKRFYLGNSFFLFIIALVIVIVWGLYQRPFSELGFTTAEAAGKRTPWWMIGLFVALYTMDIIHSITDQDEREETRDRLEEQTPFMPSKWKELPAYTIMCISAGVFEEIVFRGFLITFFRYLFAGFPAGAAWAVITPAIIFSLAHFYQGSKAVFKILVLSLLFGMIFWHSGSLVAVIILHFLLDLVSGMLSIQLSRNKDEVQ